jgi:tryptophanyl-tRNA synthetase
MSKSLGDKHYVSLFEEEDRLRKKVRSAVTDTGEEQGDAMSPGVENLFNLIKACNKTNDYTRLLNDFKAGELKYKDLKDTVADALVELTTPFRLRKQELMSDKAQIEKIAIELSAKARDVAAKTLDKVRQYSGLLRKGN